MGLVGVRISKTISMPARLSNDFELTAICDNQTSALQRATSEHKVPGYSDVLTMFEKEKLI